jgi:hypothetical protein
MDNKVNEIEDNKLYICSYCHKQQYKEIYMRRNHKNTGLIRQFKICNPCQIMKIKRKVDTQTNVLLNKLNFISPYSSNKSNDGE